jgi:hypothetical protein
MSVLLLFFDGVGIAPADPEANPIAHAVNRPFPVLDMDYDYQGGLLKLTDPTLGVEGLPQSATGQATILTGINAAAIEGRHVTAYPTVKLREMIARESIFKKIKAMGGSPMFANAYHPGYFARRETRYSVSTWSWLSAGIPYHNLDDLALGRAVSHDLTNQFMNEFGFVVPVRAPAQSGRILGEMIQRHDFVFFEYIQTDMVGHSGDFDRAAVILSQITEMLGALFRKVNLSQHTVILVSDHGNFEDLSTNTHTRNHVPTIAWGDGATEFINSIESLTDITPGILGILGK